MADNETQINLRFKVNDDGSIVLDKIGKSIQKVEDNTTRMNSSLGVIKLDSLINLGERAFNAGERIYDLAKEVARFGSDLERNAKTLGMNISEYQKWVYVAKSADVETQQFMQGIRSLTNVMAESPDKISRMGISVKNMGGDFKTIDQILPEIIEKISATGDVTAQNAKAMELFGTKAGLAFANLVREGKNIGEIRDRFREMNFEISSGVIENLARSEQAFKDMEFAGMKIKASLYPVIVEVANATQWWANTIGIVVDKLEMLRLHGEVKELKSLKEWLKYTKEQGGSAETIKDYETRIKEIQDRWARTTSSKANLPGSGQMINEEAAALSRVVEQASKLSGFYGDNVKLLKQANAEIDRMSKGPDIMEGLGIKTTIGAKKEIFGVLEKYETLRGQGYSEEEMEQARAKLEEQLRTLESKYKAESGWKGIGEEGGVRWWSNVIPKEGVGRDITDMVQKGIEELNRMQAAAERATGPKTIMIDYTPVESANEAVKELRGLLNEMDNRVVTIKIKQEVSGELGSNVMETIDENMTRRFTNKQSRFGAAIRGNE